MAFATLFCDIGTGLVTIVSRAVDSLLGCFLARDKSRSQHSLVSDVVNPETVYILHPESNKAVLDEHARIGGAISTSSSDDEVSEITNSEASPPSPIATMNKNVQFESYSNVSKSSPYLTPLNLRDDIETPGTVFPTHYHDKPARIRTDIWYSDLERASVGKLIELGDDKE